MLLRLRGEFKLVRDKGIFFAGLPHDIVLAPSDDGALSERVASTRRPIRAARCCCCDELKMGASFNVSKVDAASSKYKADETL
jgi:hypothetical protein